MIEYIKEQIENIIFNITNMINNKLFSNISNSNRKKPAIYTNINANITLTKYSICLFFIYLILFLVHSN